MNRGQFPHHNSNRNIRSDYILQQKESFGAGVWILDSFPVIISCLTTSIIYFLLASFAFRFVEPCSRKSTTKVSYFKHVFVYLVHFIILRKVALYKFLILLDVFNSLCGLKIKKSSTTRITGRIYTRDDLSV